MKSEEKFTISSPAFVKVTICGLSYDMLPNSTISFTIAELERFADLGVGESVVIKIEPKESYYL